jgi:hypothetical protein
MLNMPISVTFPLGAWHSVLAMLMKGPWETADPLIQSIRGQLQRAQLGLQVPQTPRREVNLAERVVPQTPRTTDLPEASRGTDYFASSKGE